MRESLLGPTPMRERQRVKDRPARDGPVTACVAEDEPIADPGDDLSIEFETYDSRAAGTDLSEDRCDPGGAEARPDVQVPGARLTDRASVQGPEFDFEAPRRSPLRLRPLGDDHPSDQHLMVHTPEIDRDTGAALCPLDARTELLQAAHVAHHSRGKYDDVLSDHERLSLRSVLVDIPVNQLDMPCGREKRTRQ
jgi:hypothetical protein